MYSYNIGSYQMTYANFAMQSQAQNLPITPPLTPPDSCRGSVSPALSATSSLTSQGQQSSDQMKPSKTGRTRIEFSSAQLMDLESEFKDCAYLQRSRRIDIATRLGLTEKHVKVWFQNRRTKCKKEIITNGNKVTKPYPQHHKIVKRLMSFTPNPSIIQVSCTGPTNTNGAATHTQSTTPAVHQTFQQGDKFMRVAQENKNTTPQLLEPAQSLPILKPTVAQLITDLSNQQPASSREFKPQLIVQMPTSNRGPSQNIPQYVIVPKSISAQQYQQPSQHALGTPTPSISKQFLLQRSSVPNEPQQQLQYHQCVQHITPLEYQQPIIAPTTNLSLQYRQHYKPQSATQKYVLCMPRSQTKCTNGAERSQIFQKAVEQQQFASQEVIQQYQQQELTEQQRHPEQQWQRMPETLRETINHDHPNEEQTLQHQELMVQPQTPIQDIEVQNRDIDDQSSTESQSDSTKKLDDAELELYENLFLSISSGEADSSGNSPQSLELSHIVNNLLTGFEPSPTTSDESTQNAEEQLSVQNEVKVNEDLNQYQEQQHELGYFNSQLSLQNLFEDIRLPEMILQDEHQEPSLASQETQCLGQASQEQPTHEEKTPEASPEMGVFNPDELLKEIEETAKQLSQSQQYRQRLYLADNFMDFTEEHQCLAIESIVGNVPTHNDDFDIDDFVENIDKYVVYPGTRTTTQATTATEQHPTNTPECSLPDSLKLSDSTVPIINISFEDCFDFSSTLKEPTISYTF